VIHTLSFREINFSSVKYAWNFTVLSL